MKLSCSNIKNISYNFSTESLPYISGNGTLHFLAKALKIKKSTWRKFLILQEMETQKTFLYFLKRKLSLSFGK